jgi:hypothetical protein
MRSCGASRSRAAGSGRSRTRSSSTTPNGSPSCTCCVQAPTVGLHLHAFKREGEARELFRADGRERALAPDALIHLHDDNGRGLLAFVELDWGR